MKIDKFNEELEQLKKSRLPISQKKNKTKRFTKEKSNNLPLNISHFISSKKNIDLEQNQASRKYENKYYLVVSDYNKLVKQNIITKANIKTGQAPLSATKLFNATMIKVAESDYQQKEYVIDLEEFGRLTGQITDSDSQEKISQTKKNIKRQAVKDIELLSLLQIKKTLLDDLEDDSVAGKSIINVFGEITVTNQYLLKYQIQPSVLDKLKAGNSFKIKDNQILLSAKTTALCLTELFLESKLSGKVGENKKAEVKMQELYNHIKDSMVSYEEFTAKKEKFRWKEQIRDRISNILLTIQEGKRFSFDFEPISELIDCETWEEFLNEKIIVREWQEE